MVGGWRPLTLSSRNHSASFLLSLAIINFIFVLWHFEVVIQSPIIRRSPFFLYELSDIVMKFIESDSYTGLFIDQV